MRDSLLLIINAFDSSETKIPLPLIFSKVFSRISLFERNETEMEDAPTSLNLFRRKVVLLQCDKLMQFRAMSCKFESLTVKIEEMHSIAEMWQ